MQARLWPRDDEERQKAIDAGHDLDRVLSTDDLVRGDDIFFCATGITDGDLLRGVRYYADSVRTESIVMRSKSGTIRLARLVAPAGQAAGILRSGLRPALTTAMAHRSTGRHCMLVVTTNDIPGWEIQRVCGEVFGLTVRSRNAFSQIGAGLKSMFGGELQGMTKNLTRAATR